MKVKTIRYNKEYQLTDNSIAVLPELWKTKIEKPKVAVGICSDFIVRYV